MNRFFALVLILFLIPLFILVSIFIIVEDGMPILFSQKRVGVDYTFFKMYKFRSMRKSTPNVATHLLNNPQKYILKVGRVIRKLSLDELPNLFNIIKGEMVFIGPRPALFNQDDLMKLRMEVGVDKLMPGLTGWAQINGRDEISLKDKVKLEKYYMDNQSLYLDTKILFLTLNTAFLKSKNISH
jgi:O-antigen biosynthesis protein WbqP